MQLNPSNPNWFKCKDFQIVWTQEKDGGAEQDIDMSLFSSIVILTDGSYSHYNSASNVINVPRKSTMMNLDVLTSDITKFGTYDFYYKIRWSATDEGSPRTKGATISFTNCYTSLPSTLTISTQAGSFTSPQTIDLTTANGMLYDFATKFQTSDAEYPVCFYECKT